MWKTLLGISAVLCSMSVLVYSVSSARASLGPSVSMMSNPIFSSSAYATSNLSETISGQNGREIIITDVTISAQFNHDLEIVFTTSSGTEVGRYKTWNYSNYNGPAIIDSHLESGLRVPEMEDLQVTVTGRGSYTYSGYYAQP